MAEMLMEFDGNEEDLIMMLERFPLAPVEWVPPGAVDDYIKNVVEKEETQKHKFQKEQAK